VDAKALVDGRIDRIKKDMKRLEDQVEAAGKRRLAIREEQQKLATATANAASAKTMQGANAGQMEQLAS